MRTGGPKVCMTGGPKVCMTGGPKVCMTGGPEVCMTGGPKVCMNEYLIVLYNQKTKTSNMTYFCITYLDSGSVKRS